MLFHFFHSADAIFFPKLIDLSDEDEDFIKIPKLNLFAKKKEKFAMKKDKLAELFEAKFSKKDDKFEEQLLDFLDDKDNAKVVYEKLAEFHPPPPPPPPAEPAPPPPPPAEPAPPPPPPPAPAPLPCRPCYQPYDDCEYRYFS